MSEKNRKLVITVVVGFIIVGLFAVAVDQKIKLEQAQGQIQYSGTNNSYSTSSHSNVITADSINEYNEEPEGEPTMEDLIRRPSKYVDYAYHMEDITIGSSYDIIGEMGDISYAMEPERNISFNNSYSAYVTEPNGEEYKIIICDPYNVIPFTLTYGDILGSVYTTYVGYYTVEEVPVFYLDGIE